MPRQRSMPKSNPVSEPEEEDVLKPRRPKLGLANFMTTPKTTRQTSVTSDPEILQPRITGKGLSSIMLQSPQKEIDSPSATSNQALIDTTSPAWKTDAILESGDTHNEFIDVYNHRAFNDDNSEDPLTQHPFQNDLDPTPMKIDFDDRPFLPKNDSGDDGKILFKYFDQKKDGGIGKHEPKKLQEPLDVSQKEQTKERENEEDALFKYFDTNGDGVLGDDEKKKLQQHLIIAPPKKSKLDFYEFDALILTSDEELSSTRLSNLPDLPERCMAHQNGEKSGPGGLTPGAMLDLPDMSDDEVEENPITNQAKTKDNDNDSDFKLLADNEDIFNRVIQPDRGDVEKGVQRKEDFVLGDDEKSAEHIDGGGRPSSNSILNQPKSMPKHNEEHSRGILQHSHEFHSQKATELEDSINRQTEEIEEQLKELDQLKEISQQQQLEIQERNDELRRRSDAMFEMETSLRLHYQEKKRLDIEIEAIKCERNLQMAQLQNIKTDLEAVRAKTEEVQSDLEKETDELIALQEEPLSDQKREVIQQLNQQKDEISKLRTEFENLVLEGDNIQRRKNDLSRRYFQATQELDEKKNELTAKQEELSSVQSEMAKIQEDLQSKREEIAEISKGGSKVVLEDQAENEESEPVVRTAIGSDEGGTRKSDESPRKLEILQEEEKQLEERIEIISKKIKERLQYLDAHEKSLKALDEDVDFYKCVESYIQDTDEKITQLEMKLLPSNQRQDLMNKETESQRRNRSEYPCIPTISIAIICTIILLIFLSAWYHRVGARNPFRHP